MNSITEKIKRKIEKWMAIHISEKKYYKYLFISYWNYLLHRNRCISENEIKELVFVSAGMNYGAGIAHQMHCWCSGYMIAKENKATYAAPSFWINGGHSEPDDYIEKCKIGELKITENSKIWDEILGFNQSEKTVEQLLAEGYKIRKLPYYSFETEEKIKEFIGIINSYRGKKVIVVPAIDQRPIYPSENEKALLMREKFWNSSKRKDDDITYSKDKTNIAVHIRRGDVTQNSYADRFLDFEYYKNAINAVIKDLDLELEGTCIYIFSEGKPEDFCYFKMFPNVKICLDWNSKKTFLHMVYADAIIAGISGYSVNAAIIGNGKRYVYNNSFTEYCDNLEWVRIDEYGKILKEE